MEKTYYIRNYTFSHLALDLTAVAFQLVFAAWLGNSHLGPGFVSGSSRLFHKGSVAVICVSTVA